ncbi:hypothetical protein EOG37_01340 [Clavibacter michiganensis subsp. michiganensis]|uniref:hypothetical protein n=1 Tax=Clavibacter michiganensis TaxID=28447 RepID=UPI001C64EFC5|nr:hypothetical protein [Clavibacter michiganensis]MBW8025324.1 hypothetical protein [Clavibacter michiganensis subsp. michiganensis]
MSTTPTPRTRLAPLPIRVLVGILVALAIVGGAPLLLAAAVQAGLGAALLLALALFALYRLLR